jgi:hypothetical protein
LLRDATEGDSVSKSKAAAKHADGLREPLNRDHHAIDAGIDPHEVVAQAACGLHGKEKASVRPSR